MDILVHHLPQTRPQAPDGRKVSLNDLPSLEGTVLCNVCMPLRFTKRPIESKPVYYHDITRGPDGYNGI